MRLPWQYKEFPHDVCAAILFGYALLLLQEPLLATQPAWRRVAVFWGRAGLVLGAAWVLAQLGKSQEVWPGHPGFPSGHAAFSAAATVCLIQLRGKRWAWLAVPQLPAMVWGLLASRAHTWPEILGGLVLGGVLAVVLLRLTRGKSN